MIGVVDHVELQICHFKEAYHWKCQFCKSDDVIQQHEVAHILNIKDWYILLKERERKKYIDP